MFLSTFSVRRPVATVVILIALMAAGLMALSKLKVNQNPDIDLPMLVVDIAFPGASPETVEREVLNRIEKSLLRVTGVKEVRSSANEGNANLQLIFDFKKNLTEATDEIRNAIGTVRYKLPTEMREPVI
ncbi:MAG: efflux RND transporter permease subunit, partial [Betaproteobacteria bacterium]|nr:efflux RND transporter permease subunit [Betaproteobacteria bacterium]